VFRLCGSDIPDPTRIVACLKRQTPQLSAGCRAVFETSGPHPAPARRRRGKEASSAIASPAEALDECRVSALSGRAQTGRPPGKRARS